MRLARPQGPRAETRDHPLPRQKVSPSRPQSSFARWYSQRWNTRTAFRVSSVSVARQLDRRAPSATKAVAPRGLPDGIQQDYRNPADLPRETKAGARRMAVPEAGCPNPADHAELARVRPTRARSLIGSTKAPAPHRCLPTRPLPVQQLRRTSHAPLWISLIDRNDSATIPQPQLPRR